LVCFHTKWGKFRFLVSESSVHGFLRFLVCDIYEPRIFETPSFSISNDKWSDWTIRFTQRMKKIQNSGKLFVEPINIFCQKWLSNMQHMSIFWLGKQFAILNSTLFPFKTFPSVNLYQWASQLPGPISRRKTLKAIPNPLKTKSHIKTVHPNTHRFYLL
jgi:hypothetical protein